MRKKGPSRRKGWSMVSFALLAAHGRPCPYCAQTMRVLSRRLKHGQRVPDDFPTREHVIPKSRMPAQGTLITCNACNNDKQDRTLPEWYVALKRTSDPRAERIEKLMKDEAWRRNETFRHDT